jgi:hypothetical protein
MIMASTNTEIKERPILFSGPMVKAILEGRKTQTRRILKPQVESEWLEWLIYVNADGDHRYYGQDGEPTMHINTDKELPDDGECPYGKPGQRLWVREAWTTLDQDYLPAGKDGCRVTYRADHFDPDGDGPGELRWYPSIHMPRRYSRVTLEVTGVRVERVQDITEEDCRAEGVPPIPVEFLRTFGMGTDSNYRSRFELIWKSINGPESWAVNPWVWVIEFKKLTAQHNKQINR